jgi:cytochrome c oxidase subunit 3
MQWQGWVNLVQQDVYFVGNPSGSFMYVFTGLHALHLISGIVVLVFALVAGFRSKINSKKLLQIEICTTYWHFLDGLWIYLFAFLIYFR